QEAVSPEAAVQTVRSGEISAFTLTGPGLKAASLHVDGPPLWKTTLKQAGEGRVDVVFEVPESTPAREGRFCVQLKTDDHPIGELTVAVRVDDTDRQAR
ncbi:MAG TPA: hypothetical protein VE890_08745, partial [Thermoguttaceae bacterium]|nr:hypothetical protein [Thermoguttaceae bacterium]